MNNKIFFFFHNLAHQNAFFDKFVIFTAVYFPLLLLFAVCVFIFYKSEIYKKNNFNLVSFKKLVRGGIIILGPAFIAYLLASSFKEWIHLERSFIQFSDLLPLFNPHQEYSFPSTHAAIFSALAFSIFFINKKAGYVCMLLALIIGLARIIGGVHFPIDILGGFALGALVALSGKKIIDRYFN